MQNSKDDNQITVSLDHVPKMGHSINRGKWLSVIFYEPARKEIFSWPIEIKKDLGSILTKLQK